MGDDAHRLIRLDVTPELTAAGITAWAVRDPAAGVTICADVHLTDEQVAAATTRLLAQLQRR